MHRIMNITSNEYECMIKDKNLFSSDLEEKNNKQLFSSVTQHTGISEVTYPHIRYISSRMTGFGRTYEVRTVLVRFLTKATAINQT